MSEQQWHSFHTKIHLVLHKSTPRNLNLYVSVHSFNLVRSLGLTQEKFAVVDFSLQGGLIMVVITIMLKANVVDLQWDVKTLLPP